MCSSDLGEDIPGLELHRLLQDVEVGLVLGSQLLDKRHRAGLAEASGL